MFLNCQWLDKPLLNIYEENLLNGSDNTCASKIAPNMLTSDNSHLSYKQWLILSVTQVFAELLNRTNKDTKIILFFAIQHFDINSLKKYNNWKQQGVKS